MASNPSIAAHPKLDEWISVTRDKRIVIRSGKVDLGQKISTAVAMIAAEELGVAYDRIEVAEPVTGEVPDEGLTAGSNSMEMTGHAVRLAAATARAHLLGLAAAHLVVDAGDLVLADGLVESRQTGRSVTFWELLGGKAFGVDVDEDAELRPPETYQIVGRQRSSRLTPGLVKGATKFVHDMVRPGMMHARVVRPPHYHAKVAEIDHARVARLAGAGVRVVRDGQFLAVVAEGEYQAAQAAGRLERAVTWDLGAGLKTGDLYRQLVANDRVSLPVRDGLAHDKPVPALHDTPVAAARTLHAKFEKPYVMHGSMGPSAALAIYEGGKLTVWTHSQGIYMLRNAIAGVMELDEQDIKVIHGLGPGCYGHNAADDAALDAALVAREVPGTPILLKWTREQEHAWEPYGSAMAMDLRASLDEGGHIIDWCHETYSDTHVARPIPGPDLIASRNLLSARYLEKPLLPPPVKPNPGYHLGIHRNLDPYYSFPKRRLVKHLVRKLPLRVSALRTLGAFGNVFAIESFMDELAEAAETDPISFRLRHLDDARARAVVEVINTRMEFGNCEEGVGRGVAFARYKNNKAYTAVGVELSVTDAAEVRLTRIVIAADAGQIVDPNGLRAQLEGGALQAASWTLYEQVIFDREGVTSRDWDSYPILRFDNIPEFEIVLMERPAEPFLGAGEAASGPVGAAIANAIHDCTDIRLRRMPFTPDVIRAAAIR